MWKIKHFSSPKLKNTILIEGLPGMGNVGKLTVDFIKDAVEAKKLCEIHSYSNSVFINEENLINLPMIELYYKNINGKSLVFLSGDIQPSTEQSCYEFCEQILDLFKKYNGKEIVTLGGIGLKEAPNKPKIYCTGNEKKIVDKFKLRGMKNNIYGLVGPIVGVSGLLLGLASKRKIPGVTLLAETKGDPTYIGLKGAKELLKVLDTKLKLGLDIKGLSREINKIEQIEKITEPQEKPEINVPESEEYLNYIG